MNRIDVSSRTVERDRGPALIEPIWRYQDARAIGLLADEPAAAWDDDDEAATPERGFDRRRAGHLLPR